MSTLHLFVFVFVGVLSVVAGFMGDPDASPRVVSHWRIALGLLIGLIGVLAFVARERTAAAFASESESLGLEFHPGRGDGHHLMHSDLLDLPIFPMGRNQLVQNLYMMRGCYVFECVFGNGESESIDVLAAIRVKGPSLPTFEVRKRSELRVISAAARMFEDDVDFPGDSAFSQRFRVLGEDAESIRDLFDAGVRQQILRQERWSIAAGGKKWIVFRYGSSHGLALSPSVAHSFILEAGELTRLLDRPPTGE